MDNAQTHSFVWEADAYGSPLVNLKSEADIFVISDLHLGSGLNDSSNYEGCENFYADNSFIRFLDHLQSKSTSNKAVLIINGDFIDFLRILNVPNRDEQFATWQTILKLVGVDKSAAQLRDSIVKKEKTYGLKTNDFKSVWKLHICICGHDKLFQRLGQWISDGNTLIITKGNHDLEWYWKEVRRYLQYWFAKSIANTNGSKAEDVLAKTVIPQTLFIDDTLIINDKIYIEHGHRYDNTTDVKGDALIPNKQELNLPFGSFFNRYLINRIELMYPYLDNVRPTQNILLVMFRERFPFAIKMLFRYVWLMGLLLQKKIFWQTLKYAITFLLVIVVPVAVCLYAILHNRPPAQPNASTPSFITQQLLSVGKNLGFLFLSYIFARIMVIVKLQGPHTFYPFAQDIFRSKPKIEVVTFGHTHNPEQLKDLNKWYFNTGTWIPIYESSSADVRKDKTYTFLQIKSDANGTCEARPLQRWNDDALRDDELSLNQKG
jgi:UDP-2,3-diacylglucosamine pyrophosphatase LpxH